MKSVPVETFVPLGFVVVACLQTGVFGMLFASFAVLVIGASEPRGHLNRSRDELKSYFYGGTLVIVFLLAQGALQTAAWSYFPGIDKQVTRLVMHKLGFHVQGDIIYLLACDGALLLLGSMCFWCYTCSRDSQSIETTCLGRNSVPYQEINAIGRDQWIVLGLIAIAISTYNMSGVSLMYLLLLVTIISFWSSGWELDVYYAPLCTFLAQVLEVHFFVEYILLWAGNMIQLPEILHCLLGVRKGSALESVSLSSIFYCVHLVTLCFGALCMKKGLALLSARRSIVPTTISCSENEAIYETLLEGSEGECPHQNFDRNQLKAFCPRVVYTVFLLVSLLRPSVLGGFIAISGTILTSDRMPNKLKRALVQLSVWVLDVWILSICLVKLLLSCSLIVEYPALLDAVGLKMFNQFLHIDLGLCLLSVAAFSRYQGESTKFNSNDALLYQWGLWVLQPCATVYIFYFGTSKQDILHLVVLYSILWLMWQAAAIFAIKDIGSRRNVFMQTLLTVITSFLYCCYLGNQTHLFRLIVIPTGWKQILQLFGAWNVSKSCLQACVGALLLETASYLSISEEEVDRVFLPLPVDPTTHNATSEDGQVLVIPSFLHVIPLFALGVTTYLLTTLTTSHVSLLGIVYLLLGTAMLYLHPKNLVVPSVQNGQTHPDNGLRALMLMPLDLRSTFNLKMVADSYQLRSYAWLPLSLLGWTAFLDAFLQLGFSCFSLLESVMDISMLSDIVEEIKHWTHSPDKEYGQLWLLYLIRPFLLIGGIWLFKRHFSISALSWQCHGEIDTHRLDGERELTAFIRRAVILHMPKVVVILAFAVSMQMAGWFGLCLTGCLVLMLPLLIRPNYGSFLCSVCFGILSSLSIIWLVTMYFFNIEAICDGFSFPPDITKILQQLGIGFCKNSGQSLARFLGLNYAFMLSLSINLEAKSFVEVLPSELRNWNPSSLVPCPLFWPKEPAWTSQNSNQNVARSKYLSRVKEIFKVANIKMRSLFCSFLEFMELPRCSELHVDRESPGISFNEDDAVAVCTSRGPCKYVLLQYALQDILEHFFDDWGKEIAMFSILFSAVYVSNALSLVCFAILGLGMLLNDNKMLSKYFSIPFLALVIVWQYNLLFIESRGRKQTKDTIYSWLGMTGIPADALWVVFATYCLVALDVSHACSGFRSQYRRYTDFFLDLNHQSKPNWRWQDWMRFFILRWHLDFVLILVVVVCILDNDIMHAGYLAISFYFFRHRIELRYERNRLFRWLPLYNFCVMAVTVLYQIPLGSEKPLGQQEDDQRCTFAYLVGLHKLSGRLALRPEYFVAKTRELSDIILWIILRIQTHLYNTVSYEDLVRFLLRQEELAKEENVVLEKQMIRSEGAKALHASRQKLQRYERIEKIKMGLDRTLLKFGAGMYPTSTDYNFLDSVTKSAETAQGEDLASSSDQHESFDDISKIWRNEKDHQTDAVTQAGALSEQQVHGKHNMRNLQNFLSKRLTPNGPSVIYAFFVATYVCDFSILALVLPLSAFWYAIVAVKPATWYWQFILLYSEFALILNYGFQIPARLHCSFVSGDVLEMASFFGLHPDPIKSLPFFLVYLAILFYICSPFTRDYDSSGFNAQIDGYQGSDKGFGASSESLVQRHAHSFANAILTGVKRIYIFLARACMPHESPPSFIVITICLEQSSLDPSEVERRIESMVHEVAGQAQFPILKFNFCSYIDEFGFPSEGCNAVFFRESLAHINLLMEVQSLAGSNLEISLNPSMAAAYYLSREPYHKQNAEFSVVSVDHHSRQSEDWYAVIASLDMMAFLFIAFNYSKIVKAAGSVQEITSQHVVPLGYLITLIVLFVLIVMDRLVYTMGSQAGKAALHVVEMCIFFWYCTSLVWYSNHASGSSMNYLRCVMIIKCISFGLCALQIRSGYPPAASYSNGMGRHTFVFMRSISVPASLAFHAFLAIPFVYEIRQILDWACTATTLTLYDWFKLEDINMSLYFATVMKISNASRNFGKRQPRYAKFFQGGLSVFGILLLLWVPLLVFSSGNPTTVVPSILGFSMNITMMARRIRLGPDDDGYVTSDVLFNGGNRALWVPWLKSNSSLPYPIQASYTKQQLQLLCNGIHSNTIWQVTPPLAEENIEAMLDEKVDIAMTFGWAISRDMPAASEHGGPLCSGTRGFQLSWKTREDLSNLISSFMNSRDRNVEFGHVQLFRRGFNETVTSKVNDSLALVPSLWLLRGDSCSVKPVASDDIDFPEALPGGRLHPDATWIDTWLSCSATIATGKLGSNMESAWWEFRCSFVNSSGKPWKQGEFKVNTCPGSFGGPTVVTLLERVQGGLIGETINRFGVIGLYSVVVYGIGRFLRSSIINLRMRIPYENFPTTQRLISLCQDIYIARAEGLLELEEELYEALLAVYRLPDLMYELTLKKNI